MKRTLFALVCVLALFASCNKEKPNERFIGNYKAAEMNLTATVHADQTSGLIESAIDGQEVPVTFENVALNVVAGEKKDQVVAYMTIEGDTYQFNGTCSGDVIDFEQTTIQISKSDVAVPGSLFEIETVITSSAKLNDAGQLLYSGTFTGTGEITAPNFSLISAVPITMDNGTISATVFENNVVQ